MSRLRSSLLLAAILIAAVATHVSAVVIATDWQSVTSTTALGDLNGTSVTVTNLVGSSGPLILFYDMSTANYAPFQLGASQESLDYAFSDNWQASFGAPVSNLMLYCKFWRGPHTAGDPPIFEYEFDQTFTILAGMSNCSIVGNTLQVPSNLFQDGILLFAGPVSSLGLLSNNANGESRQGLTFAIEDDGVPVEGSSWSSLKSLY